MHATGVTLSVTLFDFPAPVIKMSNAYVQYSAFTLMTVVEESRSAYRFHKNEVVRRSRCARGSHPQTSPISTRGDNDIVDFVFLR